MEPFGTWRDNYHAAIIASRVMALYGKRITSEDFNELFYQNLEQKRQDNIHKTIAMFDILKSKNG